VDLQRATPDMAPLLQNLLELHVFTFTTGAREAQA
jgi:hypothetical protein